MNVTSRCLTTGLSPACATSWGCINGWTAPVSTTARACSFPTITGSLGRSTFPCPTPASPSCRASRPSARLHSKNFSHAHVVLGVRCARSPQAWWEAAVAALADPRVPHPCLLACFSVLLLSRVAMQVSSPARVSPSRFAAVGVSRPCLGCFLDTLHSEVCLLCSSASQRARLSELP